jgi:hypothetical protein
MGFKTPSPVSLHRATGSHGHDPEKWKPVFSDGRFSVCSEIMLGQDDKAAALAARKIT